MTVTTDFMESLNDLKEKYFIVVGLIEESTADYPPSLPPPTKIAAREILDSMSATIEKLLRNQLPSFPEHKKLSAMLTVTYIFLGTICIELDEVTEAEKHLENALQLINEFKDEPLFFSITISTYNQLGILWFQKDPEKAKGYLETAVEKYEKIKHNMEPPISMDYLFETETKEENPDLLWKKFEMVHTGTLYYLAQVYGHLKDALKSAVYCHTTLKRQLVYKEYEPIDWALNAATLSQFFVEQKGFKQARHHLSAASYVLDEYKKDLDVLDPNDETTKSKLEVFKHRSADVARCWAQYGSLLLLKSKERLLEETEKEDPNYLPSSTDLADLDISSLTISKDDLENLHFPSLNLSDYESEVSDKFVLTLSEAKAVFLNAQSWLLKSQVYYSLENLASDFIDITLSHSNLYQNLLFFDGNPENQAKYQKRRLDLLENVLEKVNPIFYLVYCRKMWYELGQIYLDLLDIKLERQRESNSRPTPHFLSKVNGLIFKGLNHFNSFLQSFEGKTSKVSEDYFSQYARAQFYIGVLNGKYITLDKERKLENTEATLEAYKKVIEFCDTHKGAKETISVEYGVCKEMVELLPVKIMKLKSEIPK